MQIAVKIMLKIAIFHTFSSFCKNPNKNPASANLKSGYLFGIVMIFVRKNRFRCFFSSEPLFGADGPVTVRPSGGKRRKKYEKKSIL